MRLPVLFIAAAALAGCNSGDQQTIANQFDQTENAIENSARTIESATDNATRAATDALERQADELANRAEAVENAVTADTQTGNRTK